MEELVYFFRGPESHYSYFLQEPTDKHKGGIFFAEDTHKVYLDGELYGGVGLEGNVADVQINSNQELVIYYGDGTSRTLHLKVKTSSVLTEEIEISGGPWAGVVSSAFGDKVPSNISFQEFLEKLLRKEIWPSPSYINGSFSVSAPTPSLTITGASSGGIVLVGTEINVGKTIAKEVTYSQNPSKITGLTYGYSNTIDGSITTQSSISSSPWTFSQKQDGVYTLTRKTSGFEGNGNASVSNTTSDCSLAGVVLKVGLGYNSIIVTQNSPSIIGSIEGINNVYYYVSSFKNRNETHKTKTIAQQTNIVKTPMEVNSGLFSITGVKPCYSNVFENILLEESISQLTLTSGSIFNVSVPSEVVNNQHFMFVYPASHIITSFKVKDLQGNYVDYKGTYNPTYDSATKTINGVDYEYNVFSTTGALQGSMDCRITLNKGLNS